MEPFSRPDRDAPAGDGSAEFARPNAAARTLWWRAAAGAITGWALLGGLLLAGLAVMTAASAASNILFARPFSADYELVKHFVAVAIFMFLPYCQLSGANVSVDIFTEKMSERAKSAMGFVASLLAIAFAAILFRQMLLGMESYIRYPETTPVLRLPLWTAFPPMLFSLLLLLVAALLTAFDGWRGMRDVPKLSGLPSAAD